MRRTVTCYDEELIVIRHIVSYNIRERCNNLLLGCQVGTLLKLEVAYSTRQSQVAIDTTKVNKAASSTNSGLLSCEALVSWSRTMISKLALVLRLVIK